MRNRVHTGAALAVGLALALVAGCGDDGPDFVAEADGICRARVEVFERADAGGDTSNATFADAYEKELARLREVEPPEDQAADFRRLIDLYTERTRKQREAAELDSALERTRSRREFARLVERQTRVTTEANRARVRGNQVARELGLEVCGRTLS